VLVVGKICWFVLSIFCFLLLLFSVLLLLLLLRVLLFLFRFLVLLLGLPAFRRSRGFFVPVLDLFCLNV